MRQSSFALVKTNYRLDVAQRVRVRVCVCMCVFVYVRKQSDTFLDNHRTK